MLANNLRWEVTTVVIQSVNESRMLHGYSFYCCVARWNDSQINGPTLLWPEIGGETRLSGGAEIACLA